MSRQVSLGTAGKYQADEQAGVRGSAGEYQADEQAGGSMAQLANIRQMSRLVSRGSPGDYQADDQAGVARLSWRVSGR